MVKSIRGQKTMNMRSIRTNQISFAKTLCTIVLLIVVGAVAQAQITIENAVLRGGRWQTAVASDGSPSSITAPGWTLHPGEGFWEKSIDPLSYLSIDYSVVTNWTDPDGKVWKYMLVSPTQEGSNIRAPKKLADGKYMHNYVRYPQTVVTVNGKLTSSTDLRGEVNPSAINAQNTTADQFIESTALTNVGLEFRRRIYQWSHFQDNNYVIVENIITNVGTGWGPSQKVKLDLSTFKFMIDTVKTPPQTVQGFIFGLERVRPITYLGPKQLNRENWFAHYGFRQGDSLRMVYTYDGQIAAYSYDSHGEPLQAKGGYLQNYMGHFVQLLHADKTWDNTSDDITQPHYTSYAQSWNDGTPAIWGDAKTQLMYRWLTDSVTIGGPFYYGSNILPTLHQVNMDERGYPNPRGVPLYYSYANSHVGPYDIPPGKSIRIVYAMGIAGLSPEAAFQIGRDWLQGKCTFVGKNSSPLSRFSTASDNDWAKDEWVFTQIDSIHAAAARVKWNMANNFNIPTPPPPLATLTIQEQVGGIRLSWSNNAESFPTFEGYRIYRAMGASDTTIYRLIAELSKTKGNLATQYIDQDLDRGPDYYYYVTTFAVSNGPNAYRKGEILESGMNYVEAFAPARFVPKAGLLTGHWQDSVRVVPNPFNLSAKNVQFTSTPDKIMFVNLPPVCTIRIYSENGTLVKTLEHTDGKSDEQWETGGQYMLTDGGQRVVSGIYIAHFQTPTGESQFRKFVIVR
jgi:hypothetical protein